MSTQTIVPPSTIEKQTIKKISARLMPFLVIAYFISHIDRNNVGIASLQMNEVLGLTAQTFALGASSFFLAYVLLEIPSNVMMAKYGARFWIARIMITWGIIAAAMAFVVGPISFTAGRILLGAAEAGFFPGVILYMTYWFPSRYRARNMALLSIAIPLSNVFGSIIGGLLLQIDWFGLHGWQWLFILEGLPAVFLGFIAWKMLPNGPDNAKWLTAEERDWLKEELAKTEVEEQNHGKLKDVLKSKTIWLFAIIYTSTAAVSQGMSLWQPQMIKSFGLTNMQVGLVNAIPFAIAATVMIVWGRISDGRSERVLMTVIPTALAGIALAFVPFIETLPVFIAALTGVLIGTYASKGPFWSLASENMSRRESAAGIALINSFGSLAAFGNNYLIGFIRDTTGSFTLALVPLFVLTALAVAILLFGFRGAKPTSDARI